MTSHWEANVRSDVELIGGELTKMAALTVQSLRGVLRAVATRNRILANAVIVRDQRIDAMEEANDRLCLDFLVREQPAASLLRFAYGAIRVNLELERVGDYAESIAKHSLKLMDTNATVPVHLFEEVAEPSIAMVLEAVRAFVTHDTELARRVIEQEDVVDGLKTRTNREFIERFRQNEFSIEALDAAMAIVRRFERVSDQARNICMEAIYCSTGEYTRHRGSDAYHLLFVESRGSFRGAIAQAVSERLDARSFVFASASLDPQALTSTEAELIRSLGGNPLRTAPHLLTEVPDLDRYRVIIALDPGVRQAFPRKPRKAVFLDWSLPDSTAAIPATDVSAVGAAAAALIGDNLRELVRAIEGAEPSHGDT